MKISYDDLLYLFEHDRDNVDETAFYFDDDPEEDDHYLGYILEFKGEIVDKPYWIGYCDIDGGCEFKTATELFEAKVFEGKSIKERWEHVILLEIGGYDADAESWHEKILSNRKRINE